jgi:nitrogen regulatory protein PII
MERVSALEGDLPILVIAPYGLEDKGTGEIAKRIHQEIDAFAVINWGWKKTNKPNYETEEADCNSLLDIKLEPVVDDEFLQPIMNYVYRILSNWGRANIFILHGIENSVTRRSKNQDLDLVVGYGSGNISSKSHSCDPIMKDAFINYLLRQNIKTYQGSGDGDFSGNNKNCINQLYRRGNYWNSSVHSMEIGIVEDLRSDDSMAVILATELSDCMEEITLFDDTIEKELFITPESI